MGVVINMLKEYFGDDYKNCIWKKLESNTSEVYYVRYQEFEYTMKVYKELKLDDETDNEKYNAVVNSVKISTAINHNINLCEIKQGNRISVAVMSPWNSGITLNSWIKEQGHCPDDVYKTIRQLGKGIKEMHISIQEHIETHDRNEIMQYELESLLEDTFKSKGQWIHGDLHLSNVIIDQKLQLTLIDFDECRYDIPECDLATIILELDNFENHDKLIEEFLIGYGYHIDKRTISCLRILGAIRYIQWIKSSESEGKMNLIPKIIKYIDKERKSINEL